MRTLERMTGLQIAKVRPLQKPWRSLGAAISSGALFKVTNSLFLGSASRIIKDQSWGRPDWGAGDSNV